jgi:hypothetical protein
MKEKFEDRKLTGTFTISLTRGRNWSADKSEIVHKMREIVEDYHDQGYKLTLRQLYYQLVARDIIPNDDKAYKKISALLDDCRYSGFIDWDSIEDRGRVPDTPYYEYGLKGALDSTLQSYKLDRRKGQRNYIELWTEKDAISNILSEGVYDYTITLCVNKGFTSSSAMYNAYKRFSNKIRAGYNVIVLYFGDHDPSGLDMVRDIRERITHFMINGDSYVDFSKFKIDHIGLTMAQIIELNPPSNPAKISDPRAAGYIEKYGEISWEVDALSPEILLEIVNRSVKEYLDQDAFERIREIERTEKTKLTEIMDQIDLEE